MFQKLPKHKDFNVRCPDIGLYRYQASLAEYTVFERGEFNLNIVGWRLHQGRVNHYDDFIAVYWKEGERWYERGFLATTRPGKSWLVSPMNIKGAAIMVPGQYRNAYSLGSFKGKRVLKQVEEVEVYRDSNKDLNFDYGSREKGNFGIHIHAGSLYDKYVERNSAGCQVFQRAADFKEFINICVIASIRYGNKFTYTLMEF